jgi:Kef-type K+ transport system membrane component KefB
MTHVAPADATVSRTSFGGIRLVAGYIVIGGLLAAAISISVGIGHGLHTAPDVTGTYTGTASTCLGKSFSLSQSGRYVSIDGTGKVGGSLEVTGGRVHGTITCSAGAAGIVDLAVSKSGTALSGAVGGQSVHATRPATAAAATAAPAKKRSSEETFGRLMLAIAAVIIAARLFGAAMGRIAQPRVMGEVLGGILLGPSLLGQIAPGAEAYLFPKDIIPLVSAVSQVGLAFYLFLVGMELDPRMLRERISQAAFISNTSVAFPLSLGFLIALPVYEALAPHKRYFPFALFMGVSMSITAFPVLARILVERRMLRKPVGALALTGAAIDDVTAWCLLALATAVAGTGSASHALVVVALITAFTAAMLLIGRPLLARVSNAYDEVGQVPQVWLGVIFVSVLLSAYVSQRIGVAAIFGAFIVGLIMPRHADLTRDVSRRLEDFVVTVLLPLFFVVTGLKTDVGALNRGVLWLYALALFGVAVAGKWLGATAAARYAGLRWRDSNALGALMNTRGLTELIVLNVGLDLGIISKALFTMLVLMALVTTFMAGPALRLLDPKRELADDPEEDLARALRSAPRGVEPRPERAIIVAPQDDRRVDALLAIAEPLAQSAPPRELILARLLEPAELAAGLVTESRELKRATTQLNQRRQLLGERGVTARAAAFTSPDPGADLIRLASQEDVDLVLINGRRPLVGEPIPRGAVATLLDRAPCDVAVLVEREDVPTIDADHPVIVPFGGGEHDWAALELGAWIAHAREVPLKLLGATAANGNGRDASRLLANAALVTQQLAGIATEPVLAKPGRGMIDAVRGAGLLVVGLSERWRQEGLGELRGEIAKAGIAPTLFVRRGRRPGALAPRDDMTKFRWSSAAPTMLG